MEASLLVPLGRRKRNQLLPRLCFIIKLNHPETTGLLRLACCQLVTRKVLFDRFRKFRTTARRAQLRETVTGTYDHQVRPCMREGLRPLLRRLQAKRDEVSSEDASSIAKMIDKQVEIASRNWTYPKSFIQGMIFSDKKEQLRVFIGAYFLK